MTDFKVSLAPAAGQQLRDLAASAQASGQEDRFLASAALIDQDLRKAPMDVGESRSPDPIGGFLERMAFHPMICVTYGVHEAGGLVVVKRFVAYGI